MFYGEVRKNIPEISKHSSRNVTSRNPNQAAYSCELVKVFSVCYIHPVHKAQIDGYGWTSF